MLSVNDTWLVVGLGNPGPKYAGNRHNIGAMVVDYLAAGARASLKQHKARAMGAEIRLGTAPGGAPGPRAVIATPMSYMNESGGPVAGLMQYFSVDPDHLVVVHDELDIDFGALRLKKGGGEGGHNGLRSITKSIGTKDYFRIRCGIGRPPGRQDPADFVLKDFPSSQKEEVALLIGDAEDALHLLVHQGLEAAQQRFHSPR